MKRRTKSTKPLTQDAAPANEDDDDPIDITDAEWYWAATRRRAENGDHEASLDLLAEALVTLECDKPMNASVREFLVRAFSEIVHKGMPAPDALMLTKPRHRRAGETRDRNWTLAAAMAVVRRAKPNQSKEKCALEVIEWIGARWDLHLPRDVDERNTCKTVIRAFDAYAEAFEPLDDDLLRQLALQSPRSNSRQ